MYINIRYTSLDVAHVGQMFSHLQFVHFLVRFVCTQRLNPSEPERITTNQMRTFTVLVRPDRKKILPSSSTIYHPTPGSRSRVAPPGRVLLVVGFGSGSDDVHTTNKETPPVWNRAGERLVLMVPHQQFNSTGLVEPGRCENALLY